MDEDDPSTSAIRDIRRSGQVAIVDAVTEARCGEKFSHGQFRFCT